MRSPRLSSWFLSCCSSLDHARSEPIREVPFMRTRIRHYRAFAVGQQACDHAWVGHATVPSDREWRELDLSVRPMWRAVFNTDARATDLAGHCPVCGSASLHRWYRIDEAKPRIVDGRRHRRRYEHFPDGFVPAWWSSSFEVDETDLRYVDAARLRSTRSPDM